MVIDKETTGTQLFPLDVHDVALRMDIAPDSPKRELEATENELEEPKVEPDVLQDEPVAPSEDPKPKTPQVRSSGRVIKRPKRDLTPPPPPSPPKKSMCLSTY